MDDMSEEQFAGRQRSQHQVIDVAKNQHVEQQLSTVLHEILEALNKALQIELDEGKIRRIEAGYFQVLTDAGVDLTPLMKELRKTK